MTLSLLLNAREIFERINTAAADALFPIDGAIIAHFSDHGLNPDQPSNGRERLRFEARLDQGARNTITFKTPPTQVFRISPPSALARALANWSSADSIDNARAAAMQCCDTYCHLIKTTTGLPPEMAERSTAALKSGIANLMGAARAALAPSMPPASVSEESAARFKTMLSVVGERPGPAGKAALRFALNTASPAEAKALMLDCEVEFGALHELDAWIRASRRGGKPLKTPGPEEKHRQKRDEALYTMHKNGSFASSPFCWANDPKAMATELLSPSFNLGMEHAFHRHFLATPDGAIEGEAESIHWARAVTQFIEAFEISLTSKPASSSRRPAL